ncbi:hypothetical protein CE91St62_38270 [Lachnospiraceae bacterium]|nr:hypothetical protein [Extibacter sp. GGCC_0201]BDF35764.1 hypothetical protein CE91St61_38390 [Lachnospiraceae bacterium]BDF39766.1 hypothetical protein CE91St62_38270 [Lachnospiraceae bacterium]
MLEYMEKKQYKKAMEIADTVDWRRVKNAAMLNTVSEIYEYNGEYQKSRDILFVAYDRSPGSRKIVYRLGTLALKINDIEEASDCYEEFVKLAPKDPNQYILKYKILKVQKAPYEEQIAALEDFKKSEYVEKWAYELALLYHEAGMTAECLEECDDLILWFSEGKYVYQAMELKMKYKPLTPLQQEKYDSRPGAAKKPQVKKAAAEAPIRSSRVIAAEPEEEAIPEDAVSLPEEETPLPSIEPTVKDMTTEVPAIDEVLKAVEEEMDVPSDETRRIPVEELEELEELQNRQKSPITKIVKGATLQEALANGVKVASGIDIEEKAMAEKTEELRITGQMRIEEILQEWEAKQKDHAEAIEKQKQEDVERISKEREQARKRREAERREVERKAAEAEAARKAAEEEAARKAAEEEAAKKAAEEEAARKAAEAEAARKAAEEEAFRKAAEEAARRRAAEEAKEAEAEAARKAAEQKAARKAAEEEAARKADESASKEKAKKTVPSMTEDIRQLMEELEHGVAEPEPEPEEETDYYEEDEPLENMGSLVEELQMEDVPEDEDDFEDDFDSGLEEDDFEDDFGAEDADEDSYDEEDGYEDDFDDEEDFDEDDFEEEDYEEEDLESEDDFDEEDFGDNYDEDDFFDDDEPEADEPEEELVIEEPSEEEIQKRIKKSKGGGVPFDTGFVVTGRYDLSATSEIGLKAGLTEEQKKLFSYFVPVRGMSEQIVEVLDNDRRAQREGTSKTGNLMVIGRKGSGKTVLAVDIVKAIQKQRNLKQGKVAIVTGESLNKKELSNIIQKLRGGAIIIEKAGKLNSRTVKELNYLMEKKTGELLFVLEDQRKPLERILTANPEFRKKFTSRLELPVFINDELVTFGQTYAKENGYKLDEMGILALYSRIDVMQREDHAVTVAEVKEIMDEAISHSQKANVKHLARRVFGKSTDDSDRIILKEEDFRI